MYLIGYLDKVTRPLVFALAKTSKYVKNVQDKNNELIFYIQMMISYQKSIKLYGLRLKT